MKQASFLSALVCVAVLVSLSACSHNRTLEVAARTTVFPGHTLFPNQENIPRSIIDDLPRRISILPTGRSLSISQLVSRLGLSKYRSNVSANLRWNTYFMHLDADHILYLTMDLDTLPDGLFLQTPWDAKVTTCSMMKNPDVTVVTRDLVKQ